MQRAHPATGRAHRSRTRRALRAARLGLLTVTYALRSRWSASRRAARCELLLEDALEALEPFAHALEDPSRFGYEWSARGGHTVTGLQKGLCARDFLLADITYEDLEALLEDPKGATTERPEPRRTT